MRERRSLDAPDYCDACEGWHVGTREEPTVCLTRRGGLFDASQQCGPIPKIIFATRAAARAARKAWLEKHGENK